MRGALLLRADARRLPLPDGCVQCCVTSPPYYGLRDYGTDGQIGLEPTPEEYVAAIVAVFREVRRVLRDNGVLWLNLGDSYAAGGNGTSPRYEEMRGKATATAQGMPPKKAPPGLKPKDLVGIPWAVAFALRADGWYLRSDCIWAKPNPMPESVTDRPTKAHEYVFLMAKAANYFCDMDAVREQQVTGKTARYLDTRGEHGYNRASGALSTPHRDKSGSYGDGIGRNLRSVWTIPSRPYGGAHFATMPEALAEPCILAGSRPGDIVLDPFAGSGTAGVVSVRHGRRFIGCDLSAAYLGLAQERIGREVEAMGLATPQTASGRPLQLGLLAEVSP